MLSPFYVLRCHSRPILSTLLRKAPSFRCPEWKPVWEAGTEIRCRSSESTLFATFGTGLWSETKKNLAPLQAVMGKMK